MTSNINEVSRLASNYKDLDTRRVLNALDATAVGYKIMLANVMTHIRVSDSSIL